MVSNASTIAGVWRFTGSGWAPPGQQAEVDHTYTFLRDGTFVFEKSTTNGADTLRSESLGKWDLHPDAIVFVSEREQLNGVPRDAFKAKRVEALSPDGKELTLHGEDGNCPGSDCTRVYKKK